MALRRFVFWAFAAFVATAAAIGILGRVPPEPARVLEERAISAAELARHSSAADCWLAVRGGVYDVTGCAGTHPAPKTALTSWCGKEATAAFDGDGGRRLHGAAARARLARSRLGRLAL